MDKVAQVDFDRPSNLLNIPLTVICSGRKRRASLDKQT